MRLSEELARILPGRRGPRRPANQAPREIVPSGEPQSTAKVARLDEARERLRAQIPPRADDR